VCIAFLLPFQARLSPLQRRVKLGDQGEDVAPDGVGQPRDVIHLQAVGAMFDLRELADGEAGPPRHLAHSQARGFAARFHQRRHMPTSFRFGKIL